MNRTVGRVGGLVVSVVAAAPFVYLWVVSMRGADDPLTFRARLDMAIWIAVFGTPWMVAARLLWRAWWREAGARLSTLDGPALLLAAAAAALPADRRDWGAAMTAELAQVQGPASRWRFAAGCARAAVLPPRDHRAAAVSGALAVAATAAAALATGAALPAGRVFALTFVGLLGGLATLTLARSRRLRRPGPGRALGLRLGHAAGRAADHRRLAGRGAALVPPVRRTAPGRRQRGRDGRQPGRRDLVDPDRPGAVGPAPWRARRRRRQRSGAPPAGPRAD
jgi:hypothetical protein